jgi:hypothetical protein
LLDSPDPDEDAALLVDALAFSSMHGGSVDLDSEIGVGSAFTILLPVLITSGSNDSAVEPVAPETISEVKEPSAHRRDSKYRLS